MLRNRSFWIIIAIIVLIPAIAIGYWLASPLFLDRTVEESFPLAEDAVIPKGMTKSEVESEMAEKAGTEQPVSETMPDEMQAAEIIKLGDFRDADSLHQGSGQATIYRQPDGTLLLRLEEFEVTNGPDLHVFLSTHQDPTNRDQVMDEGYVDLGELKGNIGSQNYEIPTGVDIDSLNSVVIYCVPFHVIFSVATLN